MSSKFRLWDMSWAEAEEAFQNTDTVILPVGTLHGHGPTPISIDSSSVEKIAELVGENTGILTLPLVTYGENEKQKFYPGSISISPSTLEEFYLDIFRSIKRNGVDKILILNGHGGNREILIRSGLRARQFGVLISILEWWSIGRKIMSDLYEKVGGGFMAELAVAIAMDGKNIADIRPGEGYKGEWGEKYTMKKIFGEEIEPMGFHNFEYNAGPIIIPIEAWDLDLPGPPYLNYDDLDQLCTIGIELIDRLVEYISNFAKKFNSIEISDALNSTDDF